MHIVVNAAVANQLSQDENSQRACILGGIVPDLDVIIAWIPFIIPQLFILQHRGLFHTVIAAPFIAGAIIVSTQFLSKINFAQRLDEPFKAIHTELNYRSLLWGVFGVFLHLLLDVISYNGILLFYPLSEQRIALNLISVVDPLISVLSGLIVLRLSYNKYIDSSTYSFLHFKKSARSISMLFVLLIVVYGSLQVNTMVIQSPISTKPEIIPLFRWMYTEDENEISISLVNQLTQDIIKTYNYASLSYNQTAWNITIVNSVVKEARQTLDYKIFQSERTSEAYFAVNVTFNGEEKEWEVSFLDTFQNAQSEFYGFPSGPFMDNEVIIRISQQ
ncbi:MAG: metal-dependent hydrolase [Candidatus Heimdallarchaeota archaeon]|nr:MAG: metal-dependent hydrolase [Candidatus Heimdallarchaeota archaeon]